MKDSTRIPGYLTLSEAEEKYDVKAEALKKRCQKDEIVGAKKVGKTWFVPQIPGVDPEKTIPDNYPTLNFDAALASNSSLMMLNMNLSLRSITPIKRKCISGNMVFIFSR